MNDFSIILLCAGSSTRSELNFNKTLYIHNGKPIFTYSINSFVNIGIKNFILVTKEEEKDNFKQYLDSFKNIKIKFVTGGNTRQESVKNSINLIDTKYVLIHDGARPFINEEDIKNLIHNIREKGASVLAKPCKDTICVVDNKKNIIKYPNRKSLIMLQTPQGFLTDEIRQIYSSDFNISKYTDDSSLYNAFFKKNINIVFSKHKNEKLTTKYDFDSLKKEIKFGIGFDMHKLVENRDLIIGGIKIPHSKGLLGHSDADVLTHAIMDAILSSCHLNDIGHQFPDNDPKYKNANSIKLLDEVITMINKNGFCINNVSCEIMCEKPKLAVYLDEIENNLAQHLKILKNKIKISATTLEGLGFIGREEGIGAQAIVSVINI